MPTTETLGPEALNGGPDGIEFSITIPDPQVSTYPVSVAIRKPWRITDIYYVVSGTGSPTVDFDIQKNETSLVDYDNRQATGTRGTTTDAGTAANSLAHEDTLEIDVTATGGTTREFFTVTFHGEWL